MKEEAATVHDAKGAEKGSRRRGKSTEREEEEAWEKTAARGVVCAQVKNGGEVGFLRGSF